AGGRVCPAAGAARAPPAPAQAPARHPSRHRQPATGAGRSRAPPAGRRAASRTGAGLRPADAPFDRKGRRRTRARCRRHGRIRAGAAGGPGGRGDRPHRPPHQAPPRHRHVQHRTGPPPMIEFYTTALSFPTLLYSILLAFCVVYWLLAATGLVDSDTIHGLLHHHDGLDGFDTGHHHANATDSAGVVARLGLSGVPFMLILSVQTFFGWLITYFAQLLLLQYLPAPLRLLGGIAVLVLALL